LNKKLLTIAVLATTAGVAHAQSSVTLYGLIDAGVTYTNHAGGSGKPAKLFSAQDGAANGDRWGMRGTEDLGNGLHAIFTLEGGYTLNTGAAGQGGALFGRQAFVGLQQDGVGAVTFGRQYDLSKEILGDNFSAGGNTILGNWVFHNGDIDNLANGRINNSVKFKSANFNGLTVGGLYGFSNAAGAFNGVAGTSSRTVSVGAMYANGPFSVGGAYTDTTNPGANSTTQTGSAFGLPNVMTAAAKTNYGTNSRDLRTFGFGGKASFGPATAFVNATDTRITSYAAVSGLTYEAIDIGAIYNLTPALSVQGVYTYSRTTDGSGVQNAHWNTLGGAVDYALSKRTDVYFEAAGQEAGSHAAEAQLGDTSSLFATSGTGSKTQIAARVGIRHRF
jgi:predicted porin